MSSRSFKNLNAIKEVTYRAKLKNPPGDEMLNDMLPRLYGLFETILEELRETYSDEDLVRVYIDHPKLEKAIIIPPTHLGELDGKDILDHIDEVLYSAGDIPADEQLDINVACVKLLKGSSRRHLINPEIDVKRKKAFIRIVNTDNTCLPRAIVVGLAKLKVDENPFDQYLIKQYDRIRNSRGKYQGEAAKNLMKTVGIKEDKIGVITDIPLYEDHLQVSIRVISSQLGSKMAYEGNPQYNRKIFLFHSSDSTEEGHFDTITKMNQVLCTQYYCNVCNKGFKNRTLHKCENWCNICGRENCKVEKEMTCQECNMICRSYSCYSAHKTPKKGVGKYKNYILPSYCEKVWKCVDCGLTMKREERDSTMHECGETYCSNCHQYYLGMDHLCHMRSITTDSICNKLIFYDFECQQEEGIFVVVQTVCNICESQPFDENAICYFCGDRCEICKPFNTKENEYERNPCQGCGKRQKFFNGKETAKDFCDWLIDERNKNSTVIAHNSRAYDAYFIYDYLMKKGNAPDPAIFTGSKIMYMKVGKGLNTRLLDSLNFLPMPLAKLPKSFGLQEKKKGFFPHLYNTPDHENDILPSLPEAKYYDPDSMSTERRKEFMQWYDENKNNPFHFQNEMKEYCISDVDILLNACCKFRQLLKQETLAIEEQDYNPDEFLLKTIMSNSVDPFSFLTIASVCLGIFRAKFLPEIWSVLTMEKASLHPQCKHEWNCQCEWLEGRKKTGDDDIEVMYEGKWVPAFTLNIVKKKFVKSPIGVIPPHGYSGRDNHSIESLQWLLTLEKKWKDDGISINIQHARNGGEKVINYVGKHGLIRYKLDGYFENDGVKYACEFNGCNWHGCLKCFKSDREKIKKDNKSLAQRFRETKLKEKRLRELGYEVISKWSCEWLQEKKENPETSKFIDTLSIQDGIKLRDCYFGGRTNGLILHKVFETGEKGYYVDFTSLYPAVLKYKRYPIGHPVRIIDNFKSITHVKCEGNCSYTNCRGIHLTLPYFGVMKATFLPPTKLLHPVLPIKCNKKLKFPLCFNCAEKENKKQCTCTDQERSFTHTYCTPEIETAINMGYQIFQIHEVLHWEETEMYDVKAKEGGLYTNYINTFLKLKQQASGFPSNVITLKEENDYIEQYFVHEGISLDKQNIKKNPGLRNLSKLALNFFYGKFGQRTNMRKTKFVQDLGEFTNILTDRTKNVTDFHIMNNDVLMIEYEQAQDFEMYSLNTNVVIAAFCTSYARLKLLDVMNKLGKRVLYHDTDSIIFSVKDTDKYIPPLGEHLGDLTDELCCKELGCKDMNCVGHWIIEFVSCGPKNYTYKLNSGEVVCKVRGFSLNHKASQILNFESMKKALYSWKNQDETKLVTVRTEICRDKKSPKVFNRVVHKHYGVVYDKRVVLNNLGTVPYGYRF